MSRAFTELTNDANASAWIPTEDYASLILEGVVCCGQLSGNGITALEYNMSAGHGDVVNVRTVTARTHSCATQGCGCLSVTSNTLSDAKIYVYQWGDYDKICDWTSWKANGNILQAVAKEMAKRMCKCRDAQIWTQLSNATPLATIRTKAVWTSDKVPSGSCCSFSFDLYNSIVSARQRLSGYCYNPDTVILHPYAAAFLYYKEGNAAGFLGTYNPLIKFNEQTGYISQILGMRVIEAGVAVADDASPATEGDEVAFVIDSSRAIGEVFGKKPELHSFYDGKCNATELTVWQYWGSGILDGNAIVTVTS